MKNEGEHIGRTLSFIVRQNYPFDRFEVIIADGGSNDGSVETAKKVLWPSGVRFRILDTRNFQDPEWGNNYGHSFSRNVVIDHISPESEYVALTDADCRVDPSWLRSLVGIMQTATDDEVGAGGPRRVETVGVGNSMELMLNYYFTSPIVTLGNPAFAERNVKHMPSIAGYNSIYRRSVFDKFRYDTEFPFNTDDIELNLRLSREGFRFLYTKDAIVYHRMDPSIKRFFLQMFKYGKGAGFVMRKHSTLPRIYVMIALLWVTYLVLVPFVLGFSILFPALLGYFLGLVPVILLSAAVFWENVRKTKNIRSFWVFLLVPGQVASYGLGVIRSFFVKRQRKDSIVSRP